MITIRAYNDDNQYIEVYENANTNITFEVSESGSSSDAVLISIDSEDAKILGKELLKIVKNIETNE